MIRDWTNFFIHVKRIETGGSLPVGKQMIGTNRLVHQPHHDPRASAKKKKIELIYG